MYHANKPNRRRLAAEAEAKALRARRERDAHERKPERDDGGLGLAVAKQVRAGFTVPTYSEQKISQGKRIAQAIANFVAGTTVDLSAAPVDTDDFATFANQREARTISARVAQVYGTALTVKLDPDDLNRLEHADLALVQTVEAAVYAAVELLRRAAPRRDATWGVR